MGNQGKVTILVVDDNEAGRYTTSRILRQAGYEVREAANGREALRMAQDLPDLVILDVKLPDINGFEVCKQLKTDTKTSLVPVLHLSATYRDSQSVVQGLEGGADGYLTQPVEPIVLVATVKALLRIRDAEREQRRINDQLQKALDDIKTLKGILPICASCKKIRNDRGYWDQIESYIREHTEAEFSHGLCPECMKKLYPDFSDE